MKSLILKRTSSVLVGKKELILICQKNQIYFIVCRKKWFLDIKNSYIFLLHKIKSFGLKNIKSIFEELKKMVF